MTDDTKEPRAKRLDRELGELLQELRVLLPGVQVLFAFLLIVPFNQRFLDMPSYGHVMYLTALTTSALASAFLIAPSVFHRLRWRARDKERMLQVSNRVTIAGTVLLAIAMVTSILFVTDFVYDGTIAAVIAVVFALVLTGTWYAVALLGPRR